MAILKVRMDEVMRDVDLISKSHLLNYEECSEVLKKREQFERKINGFQKNLQDFLDYIQYEFNLLKTILFHQNSSQNNGKIRSIERIGMNRIKGLYEMILDKFPNNTTQCLAYFKFCKEANYMSAASRVVSHMIKRHPHNVEILQVAAKWYAYDERNIGTALNILCTGLAKHKDSKLLYTEVIQLEIRNAVGGNMEGGTDDTRHLSNKQKLCLEKLETYFKEIFIHIDDYEYYIKLLEYLEGHDFTERLQVNIIHYIAEKYSSKAITWNMLAQRDRKGLPNFSYDGKSLPSSTTKMKLTKCIERYKDGLKKVVGSERELLYSLYINCLLVTKHEEPGVANVLKTNSLKEAFQLAAAENFLLEEFYLQWLDLTENHEKPRIMDMAISKYPNSVELWKLNLRITMLSENRDKIEHTFKKGVKELKEKALPLWTSFIRYHILCSDDNTVQSIYEEGIKQPAEVSSVLKPDYLEWLAVTKPFSDTKKLYLALANQKPYCKELHITMFKLETTELDMDYNLCDKIHEWACEQFGKEDAEVWLNRIHYYLYYKEGRVTEDIFKKSYMAAENSLPAVLFSDFKDKYYELINKSK